MALELLCLKSLQIRCQRRIFSDSCNCSITGWVVPGWDKQLEAEIKTALAKLTTCWCVCSDCRCGQTYKNNTVSWNTSKAVQRTDAVWSLDVAVLAAMLARLASSITIQLPQQLLAWNINADKGQRQSNKPEIHWQITSTMSWLPTHLSATVIFLSLFLLFPELYNF